MGTIKIVYLKVDCVPVNGLAQLFFYTEKDDEIFWGTDNNVIQPQDIERLVSEKKILKLIEPIFIEEDETLKVGYYDERVYISNHLKEKLVLIGRLKEITS